VAQRDEVFWVNRERAREGVPGVSGVAGLEENLTVHDQPVHIVRLLGDVLLAEQQSPIKEPGLAILIGQRCEEPARVLVVPLPQVLDA
jgi:hypothetical protein